MGVERFDVFIVALDPTRGSEVRKARPCVVVSPDEVNRHLRTVVVAPLTSRRRRFPWRTPVRFTGRQGEVMVDQLRSVDKGRLLNHVGRLSKSDSQRVLAILAEFFAP